MAEHTQLDENPTTLEIVQQYLAQSAYNGLWNEDGECACLTEDLAPCGNMEADCKAGYRTEGCVSGCGEGCDFHIGSGDPPEKDDDG